MGSDSEPQNKAVHREPRNQSSLETQPVPDRCHSAFSISSSSLEPHGFGAMPLASAYGPGDLGVPKFQPGLHAPHLCGPYRQPPPGLVKTDADGPGLRVYCDLDGVLADFNKGCLELFPDGGPIAKKMPTHTVTKLTREEEEISALRFARRFGDCTFPRGGDVAAH